MNIQRAYVEITNVCNLACAFCPGTAREKRFMTPETFALLAGKLRPHTDFLYLHVMGEPLLHPQLAEILHICEELGLPIEFDEEMDREQFLSLLTQFESRSGDGLETPFEGTSTGGADAGDASVSNKEN